MITYISIIIISTVLTITVLFAGGFIMSHIVFR